jgi:hypothetical protein
VGLRNVTRQGLSLLAMMKRLEEAFAWLGWTQHAVGGHRSLAVVGSSWWGGLTRRFSTATHLNGVIYFPFHSAPNIVTWLSLFHMVDKIASNILIILIGSLIRVPYTCCLLSGSLQCPRSLALGTLRAVISRQKIVSLSQDIQKDASITRSAKRRPLRAAPCCRPSD